MDGLAGSAVGAMGRRPSGISLGEAFVVRRNVPRGRIAMPRCSNADAIRHRPFVGAPVSWARSPMASLAST